MAEKCLAPGLEFEEAIKILEGFHDALTYADNRRVVRHAITLLEDVKKFREEHLLRHREEAA